MTDVRTRPEVAAAEHASITESITRSKWAPFRSVAILIVNLSCFFVLWQLIALAEVINPLFFPKATDMFAAMYNGFADGIIGPQLWHSVQNFLIGLVIAAVIGIPVGLLMGGVRIVDQILSPYVWAMTSLPRVALIPLLILILGFGNRDAADDHRAVSGVPDHRQLHGRGEDGRPVPRPGRPRPSAPARCSCTSRSSSRSRSRS